MGTKVVKVFALFFLMYTVTAAPALAQFGLDATAQNAQYQETNIYSVMSSVISVVLSLTGIVFLAVMLYAGLRWMTAQGNEEFAAKAKEAMFAAIIGLILVISAYGIATFVFSRIGNG